MDSQVQAFAVVQFVVIHGPLLPYPTGGRSLQFAAQPWQAESNAMANDSGNADASVARDGFQVACNFLV